MHYLVNSEEMRQYDKNTIEHYGVPSMILMERAALAVFSELSRRFPKNCGTILFLCGAGNNGGDGIATARLLYLAGYDVEILLALPEAKMTQETAQQYRIAKNYGIPEVSSVSRDSYEYEVIVDALFGIGLSRELEGPLQELVDTVNGLPAFRVAVDISSGIHADSGKVLGTAFEADLTVTFAFAKVGQLLYPGSAYTGELIISDIGIDEHSLLGHRPMGSYVSDRGLHNLVPKRKRYSNKGSYGKTLIIAGSPQMAGAAYFAAKAAYYSGCGLVRIFTAKENREILLTKLPEAIITAYSGGEQEFAELEECLNWADSILIGPGLSKSETARRILEKTLACGGKRIVFDADALNLLSEMQIDFGKKDGEWIVTPHLAEMSRLVGEPVEKIKENLVQAAVGFAKENDVICVLKDARSVIGMPSGRFFVNTTGNNGMATGGSGDVLAGFLAGFLAQGMHFEEAAVLAPCLHGIAGDLAAEEIGMHGIVASDILEHLPKAIQITHEANVS